VLVAHVLVCVLAGPVGVVRSEGGTPGLDAILRLVDAEGEHDVGQAEEAADREHRADALQGDGLPEVGQVVESPAAVDDVCGRPWCS
jgi:hypothetical protein